MDTPLQLRLARPDGFSLDAVAAFYAGFTPGSGMAAADTARLTLAFRLDRTFEAVAVALREEGRTLTLDVVGTRDAVTLSRQVSRMLGLDADAAAWHAVGQRDPVVGRLQRTFAGFFTAAKPSPYDAATWGVIAPRLAIPAAAKIKLRLAETHGDVVTIGGRAHAVFPSPERLLTVTHVEGLTPEKLARLHAVALAALEGQLDADHLRAMPQAEAVAALRRIRGIGPWTAHHVYLRGAAAPDGLAVTEPRILRGWAAAAGIAAPTIEAFTVAAEAWRPFRTWVAILCARHLAAAGGWNGPGLAKERARALRRAG